MKKTERIRQLLNIVMGSALGVFVGRTAYTCWDYAARPQLYATQSAPWYTGVLVQGAATAAVVLVVLSVKAILHKIAADQKP